MSGKLPPKEQAVALYDRGTGRLRKGEFDAAIADLDALHLPVLQAEELRMWLMSLAVDGGRVVVTGDMKPQESLKIEVRP